MRDIIKRILKHITRGWDQEPGNNYNGIKLIHPFFFELLAYLLGLSILYQIIKLFFKV
jgi:hypothetical protein